MGLAPLPVIRKTRNHLRAILRPVRHHAVKAVRKYQIKGNEQFAEQLNQLFLKSECATTLRSHHEQLTPKETMSSKSKGGKRQKERITTQRNQERRLSRLLLLLAVLPVFTVAPGAVIRGDGNDVLLGGAALAGAAGRIGIEGHVDGHPAVHLVAREEAVVLVC